MLLNDLINKMIYGALALEVVKDPNLLMVMFILLLILFTRSCLDESEDQSVHENITFKPSHLSGTRNFFMPSEKKGRNVLSCSSVVL